MSRIRNQIYNEESPMHMVRHSQVFQATVPHSQTKGMAENQQSKHSTISIQIQGDQEVISSRKNQGMLIYLLNLIISFIISFQNIPLVFTQYEEAKGYMSIGIVLATICVSLTSTYMLCKDTYKIFNLYVLLDHIFLTQVASSLGFIGFLMVIYKGYWYQMITMMSFPIEIIFYVGNFRVLMLHARWAKWRVFIFKMVLLADSAVFFWIGARYISTNYNYTGGDDPEVDKKTMDLVLVYIFGLFALFVEMYHKMCDIDQTSELRSVYQLKEMQEEKKIEQIRQRVIGKESTIVRPSGKNLSRFNNGKFIQFRQGSQNSGKKRAHE